MKNNINCTTKMGNTCKENNVNDEIIKAFSEMMESFFKKDMRRKINHKSKKNRKCVPPVLNDKNGEFVEVVQNAMKQSFAEDTRRKINWEARKRAATGLKNPLATQ